MNETPKEGKKLAAYHSRMNPELCDLLFIKIMQFLSTNKLYRDPSYTTRQLAIDLNTNTRYISTAVAIHTGNNYNTLVNSMRLRDACKLLKSSRYAEFTAEEIGLTVGFCSRQSFYTAFTKAMHTTPRAYRLQFTKSKMGNGSEPDTKTDIDSETI